MQSKHQYVIVGSGLAGVSAAEGIRELDRSGSILVLGREPDSPYDRPPLTKQLWFGKKQPEEIFLHPQTWYDANGIELMQARSVQQLDLPGKFVIDQTGHRHAYHKLLLATGGQPRRLAIPGGDADGLFYYRTFADYRRLRAQARTGAAAVVIGGGFIGSELAAALTQVGSRVTMVFPGPYLGQHVFPEALGRSLEKLYQEHGIRILSGDAPTSLLRKGSQFITTTRTGAELASDLVVVGIGIRPSVELGQQAGLALDDGIVVNQWLQSSHPDVYVAGDSAQFPYSALGRSMRVEHWDNAQVQGRHAGRNMAGASQPYLHMPFFFSDLFEFGYEAVGETNSKLETVADWQEENRKGVIYYLDQGRVRGAMMCNVWDKVEAARELIRSEVPHNPSSLRGAIR